MEVHLSAADRSVGVGLTKKGEPVRYMKKK